MSLSNYELNYFFNITTQTQETQGDEGYLKKLVLATKGKDGATQGVFLITDTTKLSDYLEDNETGAFLTEAKKALSSLDTVYLWVLPSDSDFTKAKHSWQYYFDQTLATLNSKAYTLFLSAHGFSMKDDILTLDLSAFDGVVVGNISAYQDIADNVISWAKKGKNCLICDPKVDGWGLALFSVYLSQDDFYNMQYYSKITTDSVVPAPKGNWTYLFENKITHLVESGSLGLFAAGGNAIADVYIEEQTRFEVQQAFATYIANMENKATYSDTTVSALEDAAFFILNRFKKEGKIVDFVNPVIPKISEQSADDRDKFTLSKFDAKVTMARAVWKVQGVIEEA